MTPGNSGADPIVQFAVDVMSLDAARQALELAVSCGADWIEFGRPLIDALGFDGLQELKPLTNGRYVLLDTMILAAPQRYLAAASELGVQNMTVSALAPEMTVASAITMGKLAGIEITVDLFNTEHTAAKARRFAELGADYIMVHLGIDQKASSPDGSAIDLLRDVVEVVAVPVSFATYDIDESLVAVEAGARIVVQGEPLASLARGDAREFVRRVKSARRSTG